MRFLPVLAIVIGGLLLAGCGKKPTTVPARRRFTRSGPSRAHARVA